jgi:glycine betaine/proline transport system substrate-binding protein
MRINRFPRLIAVAVAASFCLAALPRPADASQWQREPDVIIGWTAWADAEVVSKMAAMILTKGMNLDVELTLSDISVQYRGVANGDLDVMLMSWQPKTHEDYLRRYGDELVDLGTLYEGANLGWVVPDYIPKSTLNAIPDLAKPEVREKLDGKIQGIGAGAGIMALSRKSLAAYGLNYELLTASGPAMAMAIGKTVDQNGYIVATGWRPHWKFAAYPLRYLEDPKGIFAGAESVHAMARKGFREDHPEAAGFFSRMHFSLDELEAIMADARRTSHRVAILKWVKANADTATYWMTGQQP